MSKFDEALGCCCCCGDDVDPQDHLREPDMSRYDNVINWTLKPKNLFGACDFKVEEMENGIRTTQAIYPLIEMPKSMDYLSTRYFVEPPGVTQQADDLGK